MSIWDDELEMILKSRPSAPSFIFLNKLLHFGYFNYEQLTDENKELVVNYIDSERKTLSTPNNQIRKSDLHPNIFEKVDKKPS